jgi:hypothetical protein
LKLLLDTVGEGKPLGKLTNQRLREFGAGLEFYPGIPELFDELKKVTRFRVQPWSFISSAVAWKK